MDRKAFLALFARDLRVIRRNLAPLAIQTLFQPLLFVLIFGRVMVTNGMMDESFRTVLVPGVLALSMVWTGMQVVAMPLMAEFQYSGEIEDRLLAPIDIHWVAIERIVGGMIVSIIAATVAVLASVLLMGSNLHITFHHLPQFVVILLLVALLSSSGGLALGCSGDLTRAGLLFSVVISPIIMFGCTYYSWTSLVRFPIMQKLVLLNPLVYASEGLRAALAPQIPHIATTISIVVLMVVDSMLVSIGLHLFYRRAVR